MTYFPAITINREGDFVEARAGVKLSSLLHGQLLLSPSTLFGANHSNVPQLDKMNPGNLHGRREALLLSLAGLSSDTTLELHIATSPNLKLRARSRIDITLFLRTRARSEASSKESLVATYLALTPLLSAHLCEAEFSPVVDPAELANRWHCEGYTQVQAIGRRSETLSLPAHQTGGGHRLCQPKGSRYCNSGARGSSYLPMAAKR